MNPSEPPPDAVGRVGVRDVAQLAGVSTQTVSRVLNNSPSVREETRTRVLEAMAQLDYRPNNAARALGTATDADARRGGHRRHALRAALAIAALAGCGARRPDAGSPRPTPTPTTRPPSRPRSPTSSARASTASCWWRRTRGPGTRCWRQRVGRPDRDHARRGRVDRQSEGESLVVEHLVGLGHRRIGRLGGPADWLEEASRRVGFEAALASHGLAPGPSWVGDWSAESGAAAGRGGRRTPCAPPGGPTAIVVANDQMALGLMTALRALRRGRARRRQRRRASTTTRTPRTTSRRSPPSGSTSRPRRAGASRRSSATRHRTRGAAPRLVVRSSTAPAVATPG